MLYKALEKFLISLADASYWISIIFAIGFVLISFLKRLVDFLLVDTDNKKKGEEEQSE